MFSDRGKDIGVIFKMTMVLLVVPQTAFAYIDPGTGSYVLQVLIGVAFGAWFSIKVFGAKIKAFLHKIFSKDSKE
jgi:hypothetical protein